MVQCGFPEMWEQIYTRSLLFFEAARELETLSEQVIEAGQRKALGPPEKVVFVLARLTAISMTELLVLASNGCGQGAIKIGRGMFESALYAEYLRQHPEETEDYIGFGAVAAWNRYQWAKENLPESTTRVAPETVRQLEENYNQVKDQFSQGGTIRSRWHRKSIAQIAEAAGRKQQYEMVYSLAASIHHASPEGLLAYFEGRGGDVTFGAPPSMDWIGEALISGHTCVLQALETLNECCKLGFDNHIKAAGETFQRVWTELAKGRDPEAEQETGPR